MMQVRARLRRKINVTATIVRTIRAKATVKKTAHVDMSKIAIAPDDGLHAVISGAIDGLNDTFTLPTAYVTKRLLVFYNGVCETEFIELVPASGTFKFNFAPQVGDKIIALYV